MQNTTPRTITLTLTSADDTLEQQLVEMLEQTYTVTEWLNGAGWHIRGADGEVIGNIEL